MTDQTTNPSKKPMINRLIAVVVQVQDANKAINALRKIGLVVAEFPSMGAFLSQRNVTLLVGLQEGQEEAAIEAIHTNCRQRVEYVSTPLEGAPLPIPVATPVTVGGATVFVFEIERYEEL